MWKKDEVAPQNPSTPRADDRSVRPESPAPAMRSSERATIGRSITIKGEVSGDEDLLIQGRVDGSVELKLHAVTVGGDGRVSANITGRVVTVEGEVQGDLEAQEQVILRSSAHVQGDIKAPRVVLEDGASFRGLVDMGDPSRNKKASGDSSTVGMRIAPEPMKSALGSEKSSDSSAKSPEAADKDTPGV